jgi:hypothetical protein
MRRSLAVAKRAACAGALLLGCGGESQHERTTCKGAWQEIATPEELRPFYAGASVWHGETLYLLAESANSPFQSRELGILFQPPDSFAAMSDSGAPSMGISVAAVAAGPDLFFLSATDASGRYDTSTAAWSELPDLPAANGAIRSAVGVDAGIFVSYNAFATGQPPAAHFLKHAAGDSGWTATSSAPHPDLRSPALVWTGQEVLAWGGEAADQSPVAMGARYDPARDAWTEITTSGAPTPPDGAGSWSGGWTGSVAVFWASSGQNAGRFEPEGGEWQPVSFPGEASFGQSSVVAQGRVVSWTGSSVSIYEPRTDEWAFPAARCGPPERHSAELRWVGNGVVLWGGTVDCGEDPDPRACTEAELQRAFFLNERALFEDLADASDCVCPRTLGRDSVEPLP